MKNLYWAYTDYAVYKYKVVDESRNIWRIYLEQSKFDLAIKHCNDKPAAMDLIMTKQAEKLFDEERYVDSAMYYAKTQTSFEEVGFILLGIIVFD